MDLENQVYVFLSILYNCTIVVVFFPFLFLLLIIPSLVKSLPKMAEEIINNIKNIYQNIGYKVLITKIL